MGLGLLGRDAAHLWGLYLSVYQFNDDFFRDDMPALKQGVGGCVTNFFYFIIVG